MAHTPIHGGERSLLCEQLSAAGARVIAEPTLTPWRSVNARLDAPGDLQMTLFQETLSTEERTATDDFGTSDER